VIPSQLFTAVRLSLLAASTVYHHLSLADAFDLLASSSAGSTVTAPQNDSKVIPAASYNASFQKAPFP